jgi:glutamate 5-kinase
MYSKLQAALRIFEANSTMILANGNDPTIIFDILNGKEIGTLFKEEHS